MFPKWPASHSERAFLSVWFHMYFTCDEKKKMKEKRNRKVSKAEQPGEAQPVEEIKEEDEEHVGSI